MVLLHTPICNFDEPAIDFTLPATDGSSVSLADVTGAKGTLIMFISNHCPYVKAVINELVEDARYLQTQGIEVAAIMSNDTVRYPDDSFANMKLLAEKLAFSFPYLFDQSQEVAKAYDAVCTPDFFGYANDNGSLKLQYRGRIRELHNLQPVGEGDSELRQAMQQIANTGKGPQAQTPSMGCSIKWFE